MVSRGFVIRAFLIIAVVLSLAAAKVLYLQRAHFAEAEKHFVSGDLKLAVREYGTAMKSHFPLSPYTERSARKLWSIGVGFEESGELLRAQAAFSQIRSSFYEVRSLYTPGTDWIEKCNGKLASIRAGMLLEEGRITPAEFEAVRARHLEVLRTGRAPVPFWAAASGVSFAGFLASTVFVIFRGFNENCRPRKGAARVGFAFAACFFALWILSLFMA